MKEQNKDIVGGSGVKDGLGRIVTEDDNMIEVWEEYCEKSLNEEFDWDKDI
jgi:hypothetical protein